ELERALIETARIVGVVGGSPLQTTLYQLLGLIERLGIVLVGLGPRRSPHVLREFGARLESGRVVFGSSGRPFRRQAGELIVKLGNLVLDDGRVAIHGKLFERELEQPNRVAVLRD